MFLEHLLSRYETKTTYTDAELQSHIKKLHTYNEIRDTAHLLMGKVHCYSDVKCANFEGRTIQELCSEFGVADKD